MNEDFEAYRFFSVFFFINSEPKRPDLLKFCTHYQHVPKVVHVDIVVDCKPKHPGF